MSATTCSKKYAQGLGHLIINSSGLDWITNKEFLDVSKAAVDRWRVGGTLSGCASRMQGMHLEVGNLKLCSR